MSRKSDISFQILYLTWEKVTNVKNSQGAILFLFMYLFLLYFKF